MEQSQGSPPSTPNTPKQEDESHFLSPVSSLSISCRLPSVKVEPSILNLCNHSPPPPPFPRMADESLPLRIVEEPTAYDAHNELAPTHKFFTEEFKSKIVKGVDIMQQTMKALQEARCLLADSSLFNKLVSDAKKLCVFRPSSTKTFAVLGDSGQGKSTLINSLLHFSGIAKTGDIGSACTSVVTEYRQKRECDDEAITIEAEYLSAGEIEDLVSELLWSYRQLYLPGVESDETLPEDYEKYSRESAQAWSALEAAFSHQEEFGEELLYDISDGGYERANELLIRWSHELEWPDGSAGGLWKTTAKTSEDCCDITDMFMADRYWPFTKIIRIYIDSPILKSGVVLADLPGLQDTNLARVRATQDYLVNCSNILIVANIARAVTDQSLKSAIFSVIRHHVPLEWDESAASSLNIAVVCTKIDEINQSRAKKEFCGEGKRIHTSELEKIETDIVDAKKHFDSKRVKELKQRSKQLLIEARNNYVKDGLQDAYAAKVPDRKLKVFCVSNKWYDKYGQKGNFPLVMASGIPQLRGFCQLSTADMQLREAKFFLETSLMSIFGSLKMWTSCSIPDESVEGIHRKLETASAGFMKDLKSFKSEFMSFFEENVIHIAEKQHPKWVKAAGVEFGRWQGWHFTQFKAWCRNHGHHKTRNRPQEDWNASIIRMMRAELSCPWDTLESEVHMIWRRLSESMRRHLVALKNQLIDLTPLKVHGLLSSAIEYRLKDSDVSSHLREEFASRVRHARLKAMESNSISYIFNDMISTYRSTATIVAICKKMTRRMRQVLNDAGEDLAEAFKGIVTRLKRDIDLSLSDRNLHPFKWAERERFLDKIKTLEKEAQALAQSSAAI